MKNRKKIIYLMLLVFAFALTLSACTTQTVSEYTVSFETNGGTVKEAIVCKEGDSFELGENPKKDGYFFAGWFTDKALNEKYSISNVTADLTLYAKWDPFAPVSGVGLGLIFDFSLSVNSSYYVYDTLVGSITAKADFNNVRSCEKILLSVTVSSYNSANSTSASATSGATIELLRENNFSAGVDKALGIAAGRYYGLSYSVSGQDKSYIYYTESAQAQENPVPCKVTFNTNGGSAKAPVDFNSGEPVDLGQAPVKDGHIFKSWVYDEQNGGQYFGGAQHGNFTLYAVWGESVNISFDLAGGTGETSMLAEKNKTYNSEEFPSPVKEGFLFVGWYRNDSLSINFTSGSFEDDLTLYAKWVKSYKIDFIENGGTPRDSIIIAEGEYPAISGSNYPTKEGAQFAGWYLEPEFENKYSLERASSDLTLYARWTTPDAIVLHSDNFEDYFTVTTNCTSVGSIITQSVQFKYIIRLKNDAFANELSSPVIKLKINVTLKGGVSTSITKAITVQLLRSGNYYKSATVTWNAGYDFPNYQYYTNWVSNVANIDGIISL